MSKLRLGVIGLSEGNGHPYSWSAIFNGYDRAAMENCGFPVIPKYLAQQKFPDDAIADAQVTHVWTQDPELSRKVAAAAKIPNVSRDVQEMIGQVDGVLLARDDAQNHFEMAKPVIEKGLPVFIDKPIALSVAEAQRIFSLEKNPGQVFSCSSLRYADELSLSDEQKQKVGTIKHVIATVPKSWDRYSIHVIEPVLKLLEVTESYSSHSCSFSGDSKIVSVAWRAGLRATFVNVPDAQMPLQIQVFGDKGFETLVFKDTFAAFKKSLEHFVRGIRAKRRIIPVEETLRAIEIVELGMVK